MFKNSIGRFLGLQPPRLPLEAGALPIQSIDAPKLLSFALGRGAGVGLSASVAAGDEVDAGQVLATDEVGRVLPSPYRATVATLSTSVNTRGGRPGQCVVLQPENTSPAKVFEVLDPESADVEALAGRVREAGLLSAALRPAPLLEVLRPTGDADQETLIVMVMDREPGVSATLALVKERGAQVVPAAKLLGRLAGAKRILLAVSEASLELVRHPAEAAGIELLTLPLEYPETLDPLVVQRAGADPSTPVIMLEAALAALDAVREGLIPSTKVLTLIGMDGEPLANYRVPLGMRLKEVLDHAGITPGDRDKVIAGGPMRGYAQFSLDGVIDTGTEALTLVAAGSMVDWSTDPCVNCGRCIEACPTHLQVQLIGRYAEFELFDRTVELEIDECIECGLCAAVCTVNRPLLQLIRLAKRELEDAQ